MERYDTVVIGAGFGGLGAALTLAEAGQRVLLTEALAYPGGCACTFEKHGARFDAGATLLTGMHEGMWMRRTLSAAGVEVVPHLLDPVVELRSPGLVLRAGSRRETLADALCALPGAPVRSLHSFLAFQERVADALWSALDTPGSLPPLTAASVAHHARHLPVWLELAPWVGKPLSAVLARYGLDRFAPLVGWLDAMCQITVQAGVSEAEAPVALGAVDFFFRGAAVMPGGMGELADAFVQAIRNRGGEVRLANRVKALDRGPAGWRVVTRTGEVLARTVVGNLLPDDLERLAGRRESRAGRRAHQGWGAATLYLRVRTESAHPLHLELVDEPGAPLPGGNHVLLSASAPGAPRAPDGECVVTCSTHVPLPADGEAVGAIHSRMERTIRSLAPEILDHEVLRFSGSPRTFARFTRRGSGRVGGIPRRAGLLPYLELLPTPLDQGLWAVGDGTGLGQSTLATALSGSRTARCILVG
ncbi:MAG: FAD-dependent oxidoreductase [Myxococcota bacterium]